MFAPVITPTGIIAPTYEDILAYLKARMRSIYGQDIYLEEDSQDGQMVAAWADSIHEANNSIIAAYNAFSPATAQGVGLSNVVKINGIRRLVASRSTATVRVSGQVGIEINNGVIADANQVHRWNLPALVQIPGASFIDVTATCEDYGAVLAGADTLIKIMTPVRGWQTVTNPADANPGDPVETDASLRKRQSTSTAIPALTVLQAMLGAIENIVGVGRARIYENDTGTTDANGVPAHSISAVVDGGDIQLIGETIYGYKTPGTGTYGTTDVVVQDDVGPPITIHFYTLTLVPMSTLVYYTPLTGYVTSTAALIKAAMALWFNEFAIDQDSIFSKLWSPANLMGDAATDSSGKTQQQLDVLSNTYNVTDIYQARSDMVAQGGPYVAGVHVVAITNPDNYFNGAKIAMVLDDGTILRTTVNGAPAGNNITMLAAIPVSRSVVDGALMYVGADVVVAFNEATSATVANQKAPA